MCESEFEVTLNDMCFKMPRMELQSIMRSKIRLNEKALQVESSPLEKSDMTVKRGVWGRGPVRG
jgi:hypothetical protein